MLILTRKLGESITIGDEIRVSVLGVRGRQVRLGIEAPSTIVVHREEIYVKIQSENRRATDPSGSDVINMVRLIKSKLTGEDQSAGGLVNFSDKDKQRPPRTNGKANEEEL